jgi:hypothetical protein
VCVVFESRVCDCVGMVVSHVNFQATAAAALGNPTPPSAVLSVLPEILMLAQTDPRAN